MRILFGTNNQNKLTEIRQILDDTHQIMSLKEVGINLDVAETADTLEGNALLKARGYFEASGLPCFADDTGLEVDALDGAPGVYAARYAGPGATYADNVAKLLKEMTGKTDRRARFRTVIAWYDGGNPRYFDGVVEGTIIENIRGNGGFGYDPVFLPEGFEQTFAEMDPNQKHAISHRGKAIKKFTDWLSAQP